MLLGLLGLELEVTDGNKSFTSWIPHFPEGKRHLIHFSAGSSQLLHILHHKAYFSEKITFIFCSHHSSVIQYFCKKELCPVNYINPTTRCHASTNMQLVFLLGIEAEVRY